LGHEAEQHESKEQEPVHGSGLLDVGNEVLLSGCDPQYVRAGGQLAEFEVDTLHGAEAGTVRLMAKHVAYHDHKILLDRLAEGHGDQRAERVGKEDRIQCGGVGRVRVTPKGLKESLRKRQVARRPQTRDASLAHALLREVGM